MRLVRRLAASLILAVAVAPGCAPPQEYLLLERFFSASRLRDRTALARFSTVVLEPTEHGTVATFEVVGVSADRWVEVPPEIRTRVAAISLADPLDPADGHGRPARIQLREVAVEATMRRPNGSTASQPLTVTLQRAVVEGQRPAIGRWVVTGFR